MVLSLARQIYLLIIAHLPTVRVREIEMVDVRASSNTGDIALVTDTDLTVPWVSAERLGEWVMVSLGRHYAIMAIRIYAPLATGGYS